jgi:hypothetical protein
LGSFGIEGKDLEEEFLVDLFAFLVGSGGQEIIGQVHEQPEIAGGMFTECRDQRGRQEPGIARGFEQVVEALLQLLNANGVTSRQLTIAIEACA